MKGSLDNPSVGLTSACFVFLFSPKFKDIIEPGCLGSMINMK